MSQSTYIEPTPQWESEQRSPPSIQPIERPDFSGQSVRPSELNIQVERPEFSGQAVRGVPFSPQLERPSFSGQSVRTEFIIPDRPALPQIQSPNRPEWNQHQGNRIFNPPENGDRDSFQPIKIDPPDFDLPTVRPEFNPPVVDVMDFEGSRAIVGGFTREQREQLDHCGTSPITTESASDGLSIIQTGGPFGSCGIGGTLLLIIGVVGVSGILSFFGVRKSGHQD